MKYDAYLQDNGYQGNYDAEFIGTFDTEEEAMEAAQNEYDKLWEEDKKKCFPTATEHICKYYTKIESFNRARDEFESDSEVYEYDSLEEAQAKFNEIDINFEQSLMCANDQKSSVLNKILIDSDGNIYDNEMAN